MNDVEVIPKWLDASLDGNGGLADTAAKSYCYEYVRAFAKTMGYPDVYTALMTLGKFRYATQQLLQSSADEVAEVPPQILENFKNLLTAAQENK
jgi:hypothetical protein